jgi:hypothetical protein
MEEAEAVLQMEPVEMIREGERVQKAADAAFRQSHSDYTISQAILPGFSGAIVKNALLIAQLRCIQAALQVEEFRLKHKEQLPSRMHSFEVRRLPLTKGGRYLKLRRRFNDELERKENCDSGC